MSTKYNHNRLCSVFFFYAERVTNKAVDKVQSNIRCASINTGGRSVDVTEATYSTSDLEPFVHSIGLGEYNEPAYEPIQIISKKYKLGKCYMQKIHEKVH